MPELYNTLAWEYLEKSMHDRETIRTLRRPEIAETARYKTYPDTVKIELPVEWTLQEARIQPLLQRRRSLRRYDNSVPLQLNELAFLLWASQGITARMGGHFLRTVPSAGALYPIETYLVVEHVEGIDPGLYHFDAGHFQLEKLPGKVRAADAARVCLNQDFLGDAHLVVFWTAVLRRSMAKYGERGFRYLFLDAGHICQNLLIAAEALNCGGCPIAAFYDQEANDLLGINEKNETLVYAAGIGRK
jgi:SagB-type dehydrogenase family enzyme